ncbi:hypothetical protein D3C83_290920 [compost metagenome]
MKTGIPVRALIAKKGILPKEEADRLLDPVALTTPPDRRAKPAGAAKRKPKLKVKSPR